MQFNSIFLFSLKNKISQILRLPIFSIFFFLLIISLLIYLSTLNILQAEISLFFADGYQPARSFYSEKVEDKIQKTSSATLIINSSINVNEKINEIIQQIQKEDLLKLKNLFEHLFKYEMLGFTLFGDKPITFCHVDFFNSYFDLPVDLFKTQVDCITSNVYIISTISKNYDIEWELWEKSEI